jgi:hypothetical protein
MLFAFLFATAALPARALDYCHIPQGGYAPCGGQVPYSYVPCGTMPSGDPMFCPQSAGLPGKNNNSKADTMNTLLYVAGGVAFIGLMWYLFNTPQSSNNPGQVRLVEF